MQRASRLFSLSVLTVVLSLLAAAGDSRADTITWTNLSGGNWSKAANWDPNQVPSANDTALITLATHNIVRLDISVTVSNLTLGGDSGLHDLAINGATLTISGLGTIASNGVVNLADGALNGGGLLTVEGALNWIGGALGIAVEITSGGVLTTLGAGQKSFAGSLFNNAGTVDAQGGILSLFSPGTFGGFSIVASTNSGVFNAATNAEVQLRGPPFPAPFYAGYIFNDGSSFTGAGRKRLAGGYITLNGTLVAQNLDLAGATLLGDCTLTEGPILWTGGGIVGTLSIPTNVVLTIAGNVGIGSGGQLNNAGSVIWTGPSFFELGFGGLWAILNNSGTFDIQNDSTFVSNGGNAAINNTGLFRKLAGTNATTVPMGIAFNNSGLVDVQSGALSIGGGGTNSGTFNAENNAVILFSGSNPNTGYTDTDGTFNASGDGVIIFSIGFFGPVSGFSGTGTAFTGPGLKRLTGYSTLNGLLTAQNVELAGGIFGECKLTGGPILWTGGEIEGLVSTATDVVLLMSGTNDKGIYFGRLINTGTAFWTGAANLAMGGAVFENRGTFVLQSNMTVKILTAGNTIVNSGLFRKEDGTNTTTFPRDIAFSNTGTVDVRSGNLSFAGGFRPFTQTAGLLRLAGGNVQAPYGLNIQGGTLSGYGTITGGVSNGGTVAPGDPIGALTIIGTYTQTGELDIDLGGLAPGADYDRLIVTRGASLRGVLRVALDNGFMPALGDNFSVLSFGSRVGKFDCLIGANLGGGMKLLANYSPTNLVLMTTNGPVQTNTMTIFTCGGHPPHLQFTGLPGQTYSIEATTNIVTVTNCVPDPCQILSRFDNWITLFRTNSPTGEIDFDDPDAASLDHRFYRARLEP
jgi:hypothetical protein